MQRFEARPGRHPSDFQTAEAKSAEQIPVSLPEARLAGEPARQNETVTGAELAQQIASDQDIWYYDLRPEKHLV